MLFRVKGCGKGCSFGKVFPFDAGASTVVPLHHDIRFAPCAQTLLASRPTLAQHLLDILAVALLLRSLLESIFVPFEIDTFRLSRVFTR